MKTILVADDDRKIRFGLTRRLEAEGYNVLTAPNGVEALRLAVEERPDLILMDVWMPVGLGFSVAQRLGVLGINIPIIFITASRKNGLSAAARELGGADFFEKPYDPQELLAAVARTVDQPHTKTAGCTSN